MSATQRGGDWVMDKDTALEQAKEFERTLRILAQRLAAAEVEKAHLQALLELALEHERELRARLEALEACESALEAQRAREDTGRE